MKQRNSNRGCPRIAQQIALAFHIQIDKDMVRRILARHYRPENSGGPSWLTFLGHMKDSLWSMDLFRCESRSGVLSAERAVPHRGTSHQSHRRTTPVEALLQTVLKARVTLLNQYCCLSIWPLDGASPQVLPRENKEGRIFPLVFVFCSCSHSLSTTKISDWMIRVA
jgi:hypothetical protein